MIIQAGIEEIPAWCFGGLKLKSVVLPSTVRRIAQDAFNHNDSIESISLSEGLESIGEGAFYYLPRLKSIAIPSTVTFIDQKAFESCIRLSSVYIPAEVKMDSTTFGEKNGYRLFHEDTFLIISAPVGSSAIEYAKANNIKYAEISEDEARTLDNQDIRAEVTDKVIDEFDEGQMLEIQSDKYDITFDEKATELIEEGHGDDSVLLNFEELSEEQAKNEDAISDVDNHARTKVTYELKSGDSVSVTKNGKVTIKKTGTSKIVAMAVSAYGYLAAKKTITIKVAEPKTIALKSVKKNGRGSVLLTWKKAVH